jgi:hypothetical protein
MLLLMHTLILVVLNLHGTITVADQGQVYFFFENAILDL